MYRTFPVNQYSLLCLHNYIYDSTMRKMLKSYLKWQRDYLFLAKVLFFKNKILLWGAQLYCVFPFNQYSMIYLYNYMCKISMRKSLKFITNGKKDLCQVLILFTFSQKCTIKRSLTVLGLSLQSVFPANSVKISVQGLNLKTCSKVVTNDKKIYLKPFL